MFKEKESFFNKLINMVNGRHDDDDFFDDEDLQKDDFYTEKGDLKECEDAENWIEEENNEGQLTVDMCQTKKDIIIRTIVAGVKPENLDISINRDMITIRGERHKEKTGEDDYFHEELYWGVFSRAILLPQEIDVDAANASIQNGLLTITMPKIDSDKKHKMDVEMLD